MKFISNILVTTCGFSFGRFFLSSSAVNLDGLSGQILDPGCRDAFAFLSLLPVNLYSLFEVFFCCELAVRTCAISVYVSTFES